jgi:hypothetical protein
MTAEWQPRSRIQRLGMTADQVTRELATRVLGWRAAAGKYLKTRREWIRLPELLPSTSERIIGLNDSQSLVELRLS